ncbi:MAG: hypothetical protein KJ958_08730 [Gammaproteobacteria bacterium]|nr:hypothetical protein [Gammaproteobacteria bacterium]MBU1979238.1 hypothetical protein [Gammaproteobacteria bacterium]
MKPNPEMAGTTSTPFDTAVMNDLDGFHFIADVIDRAPALESPDGLSQAEAQTKG